MLLYVCVNLVCHTLNFIFAKSYRRRSYDGVKKCACNVFGMKITPEGSHGILSDVILR